MPIDIPAFAYAVAVAGGGILGYVKSSEFIYIKLSLSIVQMFTDTCFDVSLMSSHQSFTK